MTLDKWVGDYVRCKKCKIRMPEKFSPFMGKILRVGYKCPECGLFLKSGYNTCEYMGWLR